MNKKINFMSIIRGLAAVILIALVAYMFIFSKQSFKIDTTMSKFSIEDLNSQFNDGYSFFKTGDSAIQSFSINVRNDDIKSLNIVIMDDKSRYSGELQSDNKVKFNKESKHNVAGVKYDNQVKILDKYSLYIGSKMKELGINDYHISYSISQFEPQIEVSSESTKCYELYGSKDNISMKEITNKDSSWSKFSAHDLIVVTYNDSKDSEQTLKFYLSY
ncbi:MAG: hypothetical protein PUE01_02540 [Clostridiaceae bacterium]|nr:hypothetical protein [Clostridiaceae bacterium]